MSLELAHPILLLIGAGMAMVTAWTLGRRRLGGWATGLLMGGCLLSAAAAGGLRLGIADDGPVRVLVDTSESTRGAAYRDADQLRRRIAELVGTQRYELREFNSQPLLEGPALLFSDGRFGSAEATGPIFPVLDSELERPADARVLDISAQQGETVATVQISGADRVLRWDGASQTMSAGRYRIALGSAGRGHEVAFEGGDRWPENDRMTMPPEAAPAAARWACRVAIRGMEEIAPEDIPHLAGGLGSCSILFLDAGAAATLRDSQQQAIASWVRNLGGSLVIVGQDEGWSSLRRSGLEEISPLSPDPPTSQREWIILIDSSGSMAQQANGEAKWESALRAARAVARSLPARDGVRVAMFATDVRWIASGAAAEISIEPPPGSLPRGPTNLDRAFEQIAALPATRREVILLTDAEVELSAAASGAQALRERDVRVSVLMLSDGRGQEMLTRLAEATGGVAAGEMDPRMWAERASEMAGRLAPGRWQQREVRIAASSPLPEGQAVVSAFGEAFGRDDAAIFARGDGRPMAAQWQIGLGSVATLAFVPPGEWSDRLAEALEREPGDDRYAVEWRPGRVEAAGPSGAELTVQIASAARVETRAMVATAPGRYSADLPDLSAGAHVVISAGGDLVARRTFPPRYPREFAAIGNDRDRLAELAASTGGRVIEPGDRGMIRELQSRRLVSLAEACGLVAMGLLTAGVLVLRRKI